MATRQARVCMARYQPKYNGGSRPRNKIKREGYNMEYARSNQNSYNLGIIKTWVCDEQRLYHPRKVNQLMILLDALLGAIIL